MDPPLKPPALGPKGSPDIQQLRVTKGIATNGAMGRDERKGAPGRKRY